MGRFFENRLWENLSIPDKISEHIPLAFLDTLFSWQAVLYRFNDINPYQRPTVAAHVISQIFFIH